MNLILTVGNYVAINQHNDWIINQARRSSVVLCFDLNFNKLQSRNNINIIQVGVIRSASLRYSIIFSLILLMLRSLTYDAYLNFLLLHTDRLLKQISYFHFTIVNNNIRKVMFKRPSSI